MERSLSNFSKFPDRFHMTIEENVFWAKRNIVDYIWKSAGLEGVNTTYPETDAIFNGISVVGYKVADLIVIDNLKYAWYQSLNSLGNPIALKMVKELNHLVGEGLFDHSGVVRTFCVAIGGTTWQPPPNEKEIKRDVERILRNKNCSYTEIAIDLMLYLMRSQMFQAGNKRTAMLAANHFLISKGCGIISIAHDHYLNFRNLLVDFYETNNSENLKKFIYENCIDGCTF